MKIRKHIYKIQVAILIGVSLIFALPSIFYMFQNKTVYRFIWVWTYLFRKPETQTERFLNAGLFFALFTAIFVLYMLIMKNRKKIFSNKKQMFILIVSISVIFLMIIPYTSTDVYSYIANGWSAAHYGENPYYTSTGQITDHTGVRDVMFNKVANCWRYETVVYGPLWTLICTILSGISFGNIDIALLLFKLANLAIHMINCILIYKVTKKDLLVLLYGLNPFILFEGLTNVHNDILIILFILLAIYFVTKKKNLFLAVASIAMATAIKYFAILLLPFIVLYAVRKLEINKRIQYCFYCGIEYIALIALFYCIYLKDLQVLAGVFIQQGKYNRSIFYLLYEILHQDTSKVAIIQNIVLALFAIYYIYVVVRLLFCKEIKLREVIKKYHIMLMIFTFVLITNFNPWYIMWLFPTMYYLNGMAIKDILSLSYASQIANITSFALWSEKQILGVPYFVIMVGITVILHFCNRKEIQWKKQKKSLNMY